MRAAREAAILTLANLAVYLALHLSLSSIVSAFPAPRSTLIAAAVAVAAAGIIFVDVFAAYSGTRLGIIDILYLDAVYAMMCFQPPVAPVPFWLYTAVYTAVSYALALAMTSRDNTEFYNQSG